MTLVDLRNKLSVKNKRWVIRYQLEFTLSKVLDYLEYVWDSEGKGHYTPIISEIYSTKKYRMTIEEINDFIEDLLQYPYVLTKLKIIESNNKLKREKVKRWIKQPN